MKRGVEASSSLFHDVAEFPSTRYQGSKRSLVRLILRELADLNYQTVLDAFGGTGCVAHALKCLGKHVTYNDILAFNEQIGLALIGNDNVTLDDQDIRLVTQPHADVEYGDFIVSTFEGVYFTTEENRWLDTAVGNIRSIKCSLKRALSWFALLQASMVKRPYNLFHRANLYMRTADVKRGFGNKASWDRPFPDHFVHFAREANRAVFDGKGSCRVTRSDVFEVGGDFDLVYLDPPYVGANGIGVDYHGFYHFLEGMVNYDQWAELIDRGSKHLKLRACDNPWTDPARSLDAFRRVFDRFRNSTLVVSYRSDGIPTIDELERALREVKSDVRVVELERRQYVLSTRRHSREMLLVGADRR